MPNAEAANTIVKTVFLPEATLAWIIESKKERGSAMNKEKKERRPAAGSSTGKRKARSEPGVNGHTKLVFFS